jgi:hypothetical protein
MPFQHTSLFSGDTSSFSPVLVCFVARHAVEVGAAPDRPDSADVAEEPELHLMRVQQDKQPG